MKRFFRWILGLLFLPACFVQSYVFYQSLRQLKHFEGNGIYFLYGVLLYFLIHTLLFKPVFLYALSHEFIHALVSMAFGGKVASVKVSGKGGETRTTHTHVIVELAPYFTPLYALLFCAIAFVLVRLFNLVHFQDLFFLLIGFSLTFHVVMTVDFLKTKQPDLMKLGTLFSVGVIYVVNLLVIILVLGFVFPQVSPKEYFVNTLTATEIAYRKLYDQLFMAN